MHLLLFRRADPIGVAIMIGRKGWLCRLLQKLDEVNRQKLAERAKWTKMTKLTNLTS